MKDEDILFKIAGKGKGLNELVKIKKESNLKNVEFSGFVPEKKLNEFYNSLDLFVLPTIYDGFSLPGLEAMASGCPIISSNTSALPEVVGKAGILVNPKNLNEIVNAIKKFIKDNSLKKEMKNKSIEQAKKFSWNKEARETLRIYKKILKCQK